jgi:hypothetical protein
MRLPLLLFGVSGKDIFSLLKSPCLSYVNN